MHTTAVTVLVLLTAEKCSQTYRWRQMHLKRNRPSYFNRNGPLFPHTSFTNILLHNGFHIPHLKQTSKINHKSSRNMWLLATCPVVQQKTSFHLPRLLKNNFTTLLHCIFTSIVFRSYIKCIKIIWDSTTQNIIVKNIYWDSVNVRPIYLIPRHTIYTVLYTHVRQSAL